MSGCIEAFEGTKADKKSFYTTGVGVGPQYHLNIW